MTIVALSAGWEARTYLGLADAVPASTSATSSVHVPENARMGPGVAGMPDTGSGALSRRSSRAAMAIGAKAADLRGMIDAHVRQYNSAMGSTRKTIVVERDQPLESMIGKSFAQIHCCDELHIDFAYVQTYHVVHTISSNEFVQLTRAWLNSHVQRCRNEPGHDDGGIKRDFFTTMMHAFVGCGRYEGNMLPAQLFTHTEDNGYVYRINPKSAVLEADADQLFELFGWLVARALVDSILLVRINCLILALIIPKVVEF